MTDRENRKYREDKKEKQRKRMERKDKKAAKEQERSDQRIRQKRTYEYVLNKRTSTVNEFACGNLGRGRRGMVCCRENNQAGESRRGEDTHVIVQLQVDEKDKL